MKSKFIHVQLMSICSCANVLLYLKLFSLPCVYYLVVTKGSNSISPHPLLSWSNETSSFVHLSWEKQPLWIILCCTFFSSISLIHLYTHLNSDRAFFCCPLSSRMGRKFLYALPYFPPLLSSGRSWPLVCLQKITNCIWNLELFQLKSSLNLVKGHRKTPTDFCCFRNIISLSY